MSSVLRVCVSFVPAHDKTHIIMFNYFLTYTIGMYQHPTVIIMYTLLLCTYKHIHIGSHTNKPKNNYFFLLFFIFFILYLFPRARIVQNIKTHAKTARTYMDLGHGLLLLLHTACESALVAELLIK